MAAYPYPPQQPGYPMQPYPAAPKPSGATAITAGVLAVLGGLWGIVGVVSYIAVTIRSSALPGVGMTLPIIGIGYSVIVTGLLLAGGILLFVKKPAGRLMTLIGCGLVIFVQVLLFVLYSMGVGAIGFLDPVSVGSTMISLLLSVLPATVTLVLAIVPPTGRWVRRSGPPQPVGYPSQQPGGYSQ